MSLIIRSIIDPKTLMNNTTPDIIDNLFSCLNYPSSDGMLLGDTLFSILTCFFLVLTAITNAVTKIINIIINSIV